ncbi:hypothetical protein CRM22_008205, partial [Opisthorchis felineus]
MVESLDPTANQHPVPAERRLPLPLQYTVSASLVGLYANPMATEFVFKTHAGKSSDKRMTYKTYKQILNAESQANYPSDAVLFHSIRAPPSLRPAMKVSDISGIPTAYTEPNTRLNYATVDEFNTIRYLPQE